jgi:hypothetical protein
LSVWEDVARPCEKAYIGLKHISLGVSPESRAGTPQKEFFEYGFGEIPCHAILGEKGGIVPDDHYFSPIRPLNTVLSSNWL